METVVHINQTETNWKASSLICTHIMQICMRIKELRGDETESVWSILETAEITSCLQPLFMIELRK